MLPRTDFLEFDVAPAAAAEKRRGDLLVLVRVVEGGAAQSGRVQRRPDPAEDLAEGHNSAV